MANPQAKKDDNRVPTALAVGDDASADTEPLRVVTASGRLLLDVTIVSENSITGTWPTRDPRDNNRVPMTMAVEDNADENVVPLRIDSRNGFLFCDWLEE